MPKTKSLLTKESLNELHAFNHRRWFECHKGSDHSFCLAMKQDKTVGFFPRTNQPCWGELREYKPGEYRPSDLHDPFPDGIPIGVSIYLPCRNGINNELYKYFYDFDHPWKSVFNSENFEVTREKDGNSGLVLKNTKIDPTVLVHGLISYRSVNGWFQKFLSEGFEPLYSLFLSFFSTPHYLSKPDSPRRFRFTSGTSYLFPSKMNISAFLNGWTNPDLTDGTLYERASYNREDMNRVFKLGKQDTNMVLLLRERGFEEQGKTGLYTMDDLKEKVLPMLEELKDMKKEDVV